MTYAHFGHAWVQAFSVGDRSSSKGMTLRLPTSQFVQITDKVRLIQIIKDLFLGFCWLINHLWCVFRLMQLELHITKNTLESTTKLKSRLQQLLHCVIFPFKHSFSSKHILTIYLQTLLHQIQYNLYSVLLSNIKMTLLDDWCLLILHHQFESVH